MERKHTFMESGYRNENHLLMKSVIGQGKVTGAARYPEWERCVSSGDRTLPESEISAEEESCPLQQLEDDREVLKGNALHIIVNIIYSYIHKYNIMQFPLLKALPHDS